MAKIILTDHFSLFGGFPIGASFSPGMMPTPDGFREFLGQVIRPLMKSGPDASPILYNELSLGQERLKWFYVALDKKTNKIRVYLDSNRVMKWEAGSKGPAGSYNILKTPGVDAKGNKITGLSEDKAVAYEQRKQFLKNWEKVLNTLENVASKNIYFPDYNFKIEEDDFDLSVTSVIEAIDPYDLPTNSPLTSGLLNAKKHESGLTFAYAYDAKDSSGAVIPVRSCQNASNIAENVSNRSSILSVGELKNIIVDVEALEGANDDIPKVEGGANIDINKTYNKIEITIPRTKPKNTIKAPYGHTVALPSWSGYVDATYENYGSLLHEDFAYLDFMDYSLIESGVKPSIVKKTPVGKAPVIDETAGWAGTFPGATTPPALGAKIKLAAPVYAALTYLASPAMNYLYTPLPASIANESNKTISRFSYVPGGTNYDAGLKTPSFNRFANKNLLNWHHAAKKCKDSAGQWIHCTKALKLNTYKYTTLLKSDDWNKPLQNVPAKFSLNNVKLQEQSLGTGVELPWTNSAHPFGPFFPINAPMYFGYGKNLKRQKLTWGKFDHDSWWELLNHGPDLSMNPSKLIGIKILKTSKAMAANKSDLGFKPEDIIQTFFFNATIKEEEQNIVFYDSQVKMEQAYYYTLIGVYEVFGSEYTYVSPDRLMEADVYYSSDINNPSQALKQFTKMPRAVEFNIHSRAKRRIYEVPLEIGFKNVGASQEALQKVIKPGSEKVVASAMTMTMNFPPIPPIVEFNPLEGTADKVKIFFQEGMQGVPELRPYFTQTNDPKVAAGLVVKTLVYWLQLDKTTEGYTSQALMGGQLVLPITKSPPEVYFQSQGDIGKIIAFRLDRRPSGETKEEIYEDLITNGIQTELQFDKFQTGYADSIRSNVKYYYTFLSQDLYGLNSHPSIIYELEMVEDSGFVYPVINHFDVDVVLKMEEKKEFKKDFSQYLRIEPSFAQKIVNNLDTTQNQVDIGLSSDKRLYVDIGPLNANAGANGDDRYYPKIKVRVRSKKTKRAFDLNLKYILNIQGVKDEKELKKLSPNAKIVKKVSK